MITITTQGGLGNQMFQYAFGLAQANRLQTELGIDNSRNGLHTFRPFNLSLFDPSEIITEPKLPTYFEKNLAHHPEVNEEITDGDVLFGYWQSEKYFQEIGRTIRRKLTPYVNPAKRPWGREAVDFLGKILAAGNRATMLGMRRGDYLKKLNYHGVMPDEYYSAALGVVTQKVVDDPILFIFSDEPDWVEANMAFPFETHIFKNAATIPGRMGREDIDLALMSYCNNAIIANSSFHWWGAWLGDQRRRGVVVAPTVWFTDHTSQSYAGDIVPDRWIKV